MPSEITTGKTVLILAAVVGCFAVLWPRLFHPMLQSALYETTKNTLDNTAGCCDVISDRDVNAIRILTEMCGRIVTKHDELDPKFLLDFEQGKMSKEVVNTCKREVFNTCGVDITSFLAEQVGLGRTYREILDNIKTFNNSVCLKQNFGLERGLLGAARHWSHTPLKHLRQERPPHMRPDLINAALRERGRAIPQSNVVPRILEGRPGPIPGMRPPMGGAGHVVPAPKATQGVLGILMPCYTIGIVMIFVYTMMKLLMRRSSDVESVNNFQPDPNFRQYVFADRHGDQNGAKKYQYDQPTKLVETAISGLISEVDRQRENVTKRAEQPSGKGENGLQAEPKREADVDHESAKVKVVNMETTASCEGGKPWTGSRPTTPTSRSRPTSRPPTPLERETATIPLPQDAQEIYLEGALPSQSQLLVSESETESHKAAPGEVELENSNDPPVILSGKMTLSLIPDPLAHEGHTGRDSGQESEQEDGHDSNGLEQKAKQHGTSTNSTQADRVEQSELSDQFEDTEPFENFDHSVNVEADDLSETLGDAILAALNQDRNGGISDPEESPMPLVIQNLTDKKRKITFAHCDEKDEINGKSLEETHVSDRISAQKDENDGVQLIGESRESLSTFIPIQDEEYLNENLHKLERLSSLDREYLQNEIESIIEEAIEYVEQECVQQHSVTLSGEEDYTDEDDYENDVEADIRNAIKESEKMRKAVHDQVEEVKSSMSSLLVGDEEVHEDATSPVVPKVINSSQGMIPSSDRSNGKSSAAKASKTDYEDEEVEDEEEIEEELDEEELEEEEVEYEEEEEEEEDDLEQEEDDELKEYGGEKGTTSKLHRVGVVESQVAVKAKNVSANDHEGEYEEEEEVDEEEEIDEGEVDEEEEGEEGDDEELEDEVEVAAIGDKENGKD